MEITIHASGFDADGRAVVALFDAGFDDALISQDDRGGNGTIEIERDIVDAAELERLTTMVRSAGLTPHGFSPPALLSAAEIADRIGRTRQSVSHLIRNRRGPGGFPAAVNPGGRSEHYLWHEVATWFLDNNIDNNIDTTDIAAAKALAAANHALQATTMIA